MAKENSVINIFYVALTCISV